MAHVTPFGTVIVYQNTDHTIGRLGIVYKIDSHICSIVVVRRDPTCLSLIFELTDVRTIFLKCCTERFFKEKM